MAQHIIAVAERAAAGFPFGVLTNRVGELTAAPGWALFGVGDRSAGVGDRLMDAADGSGDILLARSQGGDDKHQFVVPTTLPHLSSCGDAFLVDPCGLAQ